jgi:hypothetical protein
MLTGALERGKSSEDKQHTWLGNPTGWPSSLLSIGWLIKGELRLMVGWSLEEGVAAGNLFRSVLRFSNILTVDKKG